jgi:hypothetical protein
MINRPAVAAVAPAVPGEKLFRAILRQFVSPLRLLRGIGRFYPATSFLFMLRRRTRAFLIASRRGIARDP